MVQFIRGRNILIRNLRRYNPNHDAEHFNYLVNQFVPHIFGYIDDLFVIRFKKLTYLRTLWDKQYKYDFSPNIRIQLTDFHYTLSTIELIEYLLNWQTYHLGIKPLILDRSALLEASYSHLYLFIKSQYTCTFLDLNITVYPYLGFVTTTPIVKDKPGHFLHYSSNHPRHCFTSIVYSQNLRISRLAYPTSLADSVRFQLCRKFIDACYPYPLVLKTLICGETQRLKSRFEMITSNRPKVIIDEKYHPIYWNQWDYASLTYLLHPSLPDNNKRAAIA